MSENVPAYVKAAHQSARKRRTARLLRDLRRTRPLTWDQRRALLIATLSIPTVDVVVLGEQESVDGGAA